MIYRVLKTFWDRQDPRGEKDAYVYDVGEKYPNGYDLPGEGRITELIKAGFIAEIVEEQATPESKPTPEKKTTTKTKAE